MAYSGRGLRPAVDCNRLMIMMKFIANISPIPFITKPLQKLNAKKVIVMVGKILSEFGMEMN